MLSSVCSYGMDLSASFNVLASTETRKITIEIRAYGLNKTVYEVYPAERYGEALDRYHAICEALRKIYVSRSK